MRAALGDPTYRESFIRPPYGGLGYFLTTAAAQDGLEIVKWSNDSKGYMAGSTVDSVMNNVFNTGYFKNGAIILLHDDNTDTEALPLIIDTILAKGFSVGGDLRNILVGSTAPAASGTAAPASNNRSAGTSSPEIPMRKEAD